MDRFGSGGLCGSQDPVDNQIAIAGRRRTDQHGLIGFTHMRCPGIRLGIDGDGSYAHTTRCTDNPPGNFTAIGDQD